MVAVGHGGPAKSGQLFTLGGLPFSGQKCGQILWPTWRSDGSYSNSLLWTGSSMLPVGNLHCGKMGPKDWTTNRWISYWNRYMDILDKVRTKLDRKCGYSRRPNVLFEHPAIPQRRHGRRSQVLLGPDWTGSDRNRLSVHLLCSYQNQPALVQWQRTDIGHNSPGHEQSNGHCPGTGTDTPSGQGEGRRSNHEHCLVHSSWTGRHFDHVEGKIVNWQDG